MKFNKHERRIASKINNGEVYDIPSYLRVFEKSRDQAYDMETIGQKFADDENLNFRRSGNWTESCVF